MAKLHHEEFNKSLGVHPEFGERWHTKIYCGKASIYIDRQDVADPGPESKPMTKEEILAADHCKKCLRNKRMKMGDAYMIEHGYPLIDPVRRK